MDWYGKLNLSPQHYTPILARVYPGIGLTRHNYDFLFAICYMLLNGGLKTFNVYEFNDSHKILDIGIHQRALRYTTIETI